MIRSPAILLVLATTALVACGSLIDKDPGREEAPVAAPGTVMLIDDWSCLASETGTWDCTERNPEPAYIPSLPPVPPYQSEPEPEPEPEPVPEAVPIMASTATHGSRDWQQIPATGYVLQLAAHRLLANAENALAVLDAPGAELVKTRAGQGDLYVIIAGSYSSRSAALAAAEEFQDRNKGADYWVRDAADFLKAL